MNNDIIITNNTPEEISITENENQSITISSGGNVIGIIDVLVNGNSVVSGNTAYVIVPTKTSQLINDSGYITEETDPTVPTAVKNISIADINAWNNKQNTLVSGSTIKTINNESILGSGNIQISGTQYSAGTGIDITEDVISNTITSYEDLTDLPEIPTKTSDLLNDNNFVSDNELSEVAFDGSYTSLSNTPTIPDSTSQLVNDSDYVTGSEVSTEIQTAISTKQDTLVSGTNIKTINNNSILGSGDLVVSGGTPTDVQINGTSIVNNNVANIVTESAYNSSTNKIVTKSDLPLINTINFGGGIWFNVTLANGSGWRLIIPIQNPNNVQPTVNLTASYFGTNGWSSCNINVAGYNQTLISLAFDNITDVNASDVTLLISIAGTITI